MVKLLKERVADGAALLDEKKPEWWKLVNPETLDMSDYCSCVLGEVYGNYGAGCDALGLHSDDTVTYGFEKVSGAAEGSYIWLRREWLKQIAARKPKPDAVQEGAPQASAKTGIRCDDYGQTAQ